MKILIDKATVEQALEALEHISKVKCDHSKGLCTCEYREAADAIKAALAQPAQEPYGFVFLREGMAQMKKLKEALAQPAQEPVETIKPGSPTSSDAQ